MSIQLKSDADLFVWPDGTRCLREDYDRLNIQHTNDDFEVVPADTERWRALTGEDAC